MKSKMKWFIATAAAFTMMAIFSITASRNPVHAQGGAAAFQGVPHCTMGKASGTYGYQMRGQIIGVGPFLVNGLFTHNYDGTMDADVQLVVGQQSFPASGTGGKWTINDDCTGSGTFAVPALNLQVTYNFIATDGGNQIDLLNTNAGVLLQGYGRRIAAPGKAPSCNNGTVLGSYGYRLDGSLPNVPTFIIAGTFTHTVDNNYKGGWGGTDTFNAMGQYVPRINNGIYTLNSNCRGTGFYTDNLGNQINYVFTVVDGGDTLFVQGNEPGVAASGIARRIR